jgi:hypothetical protein
MTSLSHFLLKNYLYNYHGIYIIGMIVILLYICIHEQDLNSYGVHISSVYK